MLNVRDECDLPEDDGYDLFTRETEVERRRKDEPQFGTRRRDCDGDWASLSGQAHECR
ncbi:MAG TPA: hypothetical protein VFC29_15270 [Candidatus Limnocylindrales bacterium]|jgi:hypothetical protein|nr:hypothetical protein [Candidatus Limnocylindrales bacterium]